MGFKWFSDLFKKSESKKHTENILPNEQGVSNKTIVGKQKEAKDKLSIEKGAAQKANKVREQKEPEENLSIEDRIRKREEQEKLAAKKLKKESTKITDTHTLRKALYVDKSSLTTTYIDFLFPFRPATIYCHSVLIDKLGDITKFIIQSLYTGKTLREIKELTGLGDIAVDEETEYLVRGKLLTKETSIQLTDQGQQYGQLLERYNQPSSESHRARDLRQNIIQSFCQGKTLIEIKEQMLIEEAEFDRAIEGLVEDQLLAKVEIVYLTELGHQYGMLLERFERLSNGIQVELNTYTDRFEEVKKRKGADSSQDAFVLSELFIKLLTKNDNYQNSMEIAKKHIEEDIPFCEEIRESLYTTVEVADHPYYRRMRLSDFSRGTARQAGENEPRKVPVHITAERVTFKAKDKDLDSHRQATFALKDLLENDPSLLTGEGSTLAKKAKEEYEAKEIVAIANTLTGKITGDSIKIQNDAEENGIAVADSNKLEYGWSDEIPDNLRFEETKRERLYLTEFFPYSSMNEVLT